MKRFTMAYVLWLIALATVLGVMLEWYRRIEKIGWAEVGARLRGPIEDTPTDDGTGE